jgi:transcriptional regulator with XRE-family HTH domain
MKCFFKKQVLPLFFLKKLIMRIVDRLKEYLDSRNITHSTFQKVCGLSNGYLSNQLRAKGAIGSDIILKIHTAYAELSLIWLLTGKGDMILRYSNQIVQEEEARYTSEKDELIKVLRSQVKLLEANTADKDRIIRLLEKQHGEGRKRTEK